jgi:hypothetical protein
MTQPLVFDSEDLPPRPRAPLGTIDSAPLAPVPSVPANPPGIKSLGTGTLAPVDSEALPPAPPVPSLGDSLEVLNKALGGNPVEGPLVPPVVPAPAPIPAAPFALNGIPSGDLAVRNQWKTPGGTGPSFFIQSPENPGEVPALPPTPPTFGPVDP